MENAFNLWLKKATADKDLIPELEMMKTDLEKMNDAFFRELEFGTGGLRGKIGAGTNRMNVYTVARATTGLANYLINTYSGEKRVAIGYDTRIKSQLFAEIVAKVLSTKGIKAFLFNRPLPTPTLSFAVRELDCNAGIMITASHNPAVYNGYKVYGQDGCQITTKAADEIYSEISRSDYFDCISEDTNNNITYIPQDVYNRFISSVSKLSLTDDVDKSISVVYTPLNGTGMEPVTDILKQKGYKNVSVVKEQSEHNGNFPTCPFPNPELPEAMELGLRYSEKIGADILLATDPDCDRVGVAIKNGSGYKLLTGNEVGILLLEYICHRKRESGNMPNNPICVKTIVTTDLAEDIAKDFGIETYNVLTGFKFIGEKIGELEKVGERERYIFGFEESCGYLSGTHVRDKDGVNAALLICEMCAYYKKQGISLADKLSSVYKKYGYSLSVLLSYTFEGAVGMQKMTEFMSSMRKISRNFSDFDIINCLDYSVGIDGLPSSDVLKFTFNNDCSLVIRPSGTEPKLKFYLTAKGEDELKAKKKTEQLKKNIENLINNMG